MKSTLKTVSLFLEDLKSLSNPKQTIKKDIHHRMYDPKTRHLFVLVVNLCLNYIFHIYFFFAVRPLNTRAAGESTKLHLSYTHLKFHGVVIICQIPPAHKAAIPRSL